MGPLRDGLGGDAAVMQRTTGRGEGVVKDGVGVDERDALKGEVLAADEGVGSAMLFLSITIGLSWALLCSFFL